MESMLLVLLQKAVGKFSCHVWVQYLNTYVLVCKMTSSTYIMFAYLHTLACACVHTRP